MQVQSLSLKAYEEKISAQLQEVQARIDLFEAQAKKKKTDVEIEAIRAVKAMKQAIDEKYQQLKPAGEAAVARLKADLDADVAKLRASVDGFASKFKS